MFRATFFQIIIKTGLAPSLLVLRCPVLYHGVLRYKLLPFYIIHHYGTDVRPDVNNVCFLSYCLKVDHQNRPCRFR